MQEHGAVVLYNGIFPVLPTQGIAGERDHEHLSLGAYNIHLSLGGHKNIHMEGVKNISSHLLRARAVGARVVLVAVKGDAGKLAMYSALQEVGFLGKEGFAVVDGAMLQLPSSDDRIVSGKYGIDGIVHMSKNRREEKKEKRPHPLSLSLCLLEFGKKVFRLACTNIFVSSLLPGVGKHVCTAEKCPLTACEPNCAADPREINQAFDAVIVLAAGLAPFFRDGGSTYLAGVSESRKAAMDAIRSSSLSSRIAASGLLAFAGEPERERERERVCVCVFVCVCVCVASSSLLSGPFPLLP